MPLEPGLHPEPGDFSNAGELSVMQLTQIDKNAN